MNPNVGAGDIVISSPRCGYGRFAAAIVEEIEICIAEVTICDAIDDVVKA
jgi:hypothetical protein